jgi:hypothetical protein
MLSRSWLLVAVFVVTSSSGCGAMVLRGHEVEHPSPWPLVASASNEARPTVLVRMLDVPAEAKDRKDDLYLASEFTAPLESGLFSAVAYERPGETARDVETDYVLDVSIDHDLKVRWYSVAGMLTLGAIPVSVPDVFTVSAVLYDSWHHELARFNERDHVQYVLWLPLLPLDAAFTVVPGGKHLGLDKREWEGERRRTVDDLLATILAKANNQVHFTAARLPGGEPR